MLIFFNNFFSFTILITVKGIYTRISVFILSSVFRNRTIIQFLFNLLII